MLNLFSERNKAKNIEEIIIFDKLPEKLRIQLKFIVEDILDNYKNGYENIHKLFCEEYGKLSLSAYPLGYRDKESILNLFINEKDNINIILDLVEITLLYHASNLHEKYSYNPNHAKQLMQNIEKKINIRFKESSVGYKIIDLQFIKVDSEVTFNEIIKPTIKLTHNKMFENVNLEYIEALKAYQNGDHKNCLVKCLNSFESTMKIICDENNWEYEDHATSNRLLNICFENELIPKKMQSEFTSLRSLLESGIPPVRNHYAGHGKGKETVDVEDYLARYAVNITGSCILLLIELSKL